MNTILIIFGVFIFLSIFAISGYNRNYDNGSNIVVAPPNFNFAIILVAFLSLSIGYLLTNYLGGDIFTSSFNTEKEKSNPPVSKKQTDSTYKVAYKTAVVSTPKINSKPVPSQEVYEEEQIEYIYIESKPKVYFTPKHDYAIILAKNISQEKALNIQSRYLMRHIKVMELPNGNYYLAVTFHDKEKAEREKRDWLRHQDVIKKHNLNPQVVDYKNWIQNNY